jgi:hypothetical protein
MPNFASPPYLAALPDFAAPGNIRPRTDRFSSDKKESYLMSRGIATMIVLASLGAALAGCGRTEGQRAASGGLIGAGAGAGIAAVAGGPVLGAALLGGAVGAGTGALTAPDRR